MKGYEDALDVFLLDPYLLVIITRNIPFGRLRVLLLSGYKQSN